MYPYLQVLNSVSRIFPMEMAYERPGLHCGVRTPSLVGRLTVCFLDAVFETVFSVRVFVCGGLSTTASMLGIVSKNTGCDSDENTIRCRALRISPVTCCNPPLAGAGTESEETPSVICEALRKDCR